MAAATMMTGSEHSVLLGVGANLGDRRASIRRAIELLNEDPDVRVVASSRLIETAPQGGPPQGRYLNGAIAVSSRRSPGELLALLHDIERHLGRERTVRNGPRTLDLDLLLFDDIVQAEPDLVIPHPRMLERAFVLEPLVEIAPERKHPVSGRTIAAHWRDLVARTGVGEAGR